MTKTAVESAVEVMYAHLAALNSRDEDAIAKTLHFPHFRLSGNNVKIWQSPDNYLEDFHMRAGDTWDHTEWGHLTPIQSSKQKVHLDVQVRRFARDGTLLVEFPSFWAITCIDGVWAAQMRSSFAVDPEQAALISP
ncbi:MAG: hypothetical protein AAF468_00190 [Pseudomonadota bacterium]